jgi:hypothetical protein
MFSAGISFVVLPHTGHTKKYFLLAIRGLLKKINPKQKPV